MFNFWYIVFENGNKQETQFLYPIKIITTRIASEGGRGGEKVKEERRGKISPINENKVINRE